MDLKATKKFHKSLRKLPPDVLRRLQRTINLIKISRDVDDLSRRVGPGNIKPLRAKGGKFYSIRLGLHWQLGIEVRGNVVVLMKIGSRENFYRDFP